MATHYCPTCGQPSHGKLRQAWIVACTRCGARVAGRQGLPDKYFGLVDDWSQIQIGTTGTFKEKTFEVTGRVRFRFTSDFRNLWCAAYDGGILWICQSLESVGFFASEFTRYPMEFNPPASGIQISFSEQTRLKCELSDTCEQMTFHGEVARFPYTSLPLKLIQARNSQHNTVLISWKGPTDCEFIWGELMMSSKAVFNHTRTFDDW